MKRRVLEKGCTYEVMEPISYSAAATLQHRPRFSPRCPQNAVLDVSAKAHFTLTVSFGYGTPKSHIKTPLHGIPFEFRWEPPDESAIPALQHRLKALCNNKDAITDVRAHPSTRLACALFDIPAVTAGLSDAELKSASMLTGAFNRDLRLAAKRSLFERDPADRRYLDEMVRLIQANPIAVHHLADSEFWHADLTEAVVSATRHRHARGTALRLLEAHRNDGEHNAQFVQQLETIKQELAWQSKWNRYGVVTIVLGALGIVTLLFISIRFWKRRKLIASRRLSDGG